jgi:hypothetical protein
MHVVFIHMSIVIVIDNWQFLAKEENLWFSFVPQLWLNHIMFSRCLNPIQISKSCGFCGYGFGTFFQKPLDSIQKLNLVSCITYTYTLCNLQVWRFISTNFYNVLYKY